jgi:hypothetical protein
LKRTSPKSHVPKMLPLSPSFRARCAILAAIPCVFKGRSARGYPPILDCTFQDSRELGAPLKPRFWLERASHSLHSLCVLYGERIVTRLVRPHRRTHKPCVPRILPATYSFQKILPDLCLPAPPISFVLKDRTRNRGEGGGYFWGEGSPQTVCYARGPGSCRPRLPLRCAASALSSLQALGPPTPPTTDRVAALRMTCWELGTGQLATDNWQLATATGNWELGTHNWNEKAFGLSAQSA